MELQLDWDLDKVKRGWTPGPDTVHLLGRLLELSPGVTAEGGPRRVLEVAAAEAVHSCNLSLRGIESFVIEPSPLMLARARERMAECGARLTLVRGVAETMPFKDGTFDRVLLDSAIDHLARPQLGIAEMTRVLKPDGRLVIGFVNYESVSVRFSRGLYRLARRLGLVAREARLFWDTPVPAEHTFECTYSLLQKLCAPYLELDRAFGVSIGWMVPGWSRLLKRLGEDRAAALLQRLDAFAHRAPHRADFVMTVWRPRAGRATAAGPPAWPPAADGATATTDLLYPSKAYAEADFWGRSNLAGGCFDLGRPGSGDPVDRMANELYTGDPTRSWLDDLIARGPFVDAASLGCDDGAYERRWLTNGGSRRLDVFELSPAVIRAVRASLGLGWWATHGPAARVRFFRTDLNFVRLPASCYDVVWSSGCLHHVIDLEHLFAEVERALRPGGLFAFCEYVGERRMQFAPDRLARINAVLREVPARFRRVETLASSHIATLSPFCGVRSDDILPLVEARFDLVHKVAGGALFPLNFGIHSTIEHEAPEAWARVRAAEQEALRDPDARPCGVYAVFRKRG